MTALGLSMLESQIVSLHNDMCANKVPVPLLAPFPPNFFAAANAKPTETKVPRWNLRESDLRLLEAAFSMDNFPSSFVRQRLANELNVSCRQVQVWFQNRRQRARNQEREMNGAEEVEAEVDAVNPQGATPTEISQLLSHAAEVTRAAEEFFSSHESARPNTGAAKDKSAPAQLAEGEALAPQGAVHETAERTAPSPTLSATSSERELAVAIPSAESSTRQPVEATVVIAEKSTKRRSGPTTPLPADSCTVHASKVLASAKAATSNKRPREEALTPNKERFKENAPQPFAKRGKVSEARLPGALDLFMSQRQQAQKQASMQVMQQLMASQAMLSGSPQVPVPNAFNGMLGAAPQISMPHAFNNMLGVSPFANLDASSAMKASATAPSMFPFAPPVPPPSAYSAPLPVPTPFAPKPMAMPGMPPAASAPTAAPNSDRVGQGFNTLDTHALTTAFLQLAQTAMARAQHGDSQAQLISTLSALFAQSGANPASVLPPMPFEAAKEPRVDRATKMPRLDKPSFPHEPSYATNSAASDGLLSSCIADANAFKGDYMDENGDAIVEDLSDEDRDEIVSQLGELLYTENYQ